MLGTLRAPRSPKPHVADRLLATLIALPALTDFAVAVGGLVFAAYARFVDRSGIEAMFGVVIASVFACLAIFALLREMRLARVIERHHQIDLRTLDRYEIQQLSIALFRLRGYQVVACQDPIAHQAADLTLRRGKSSTLLRLRDWDDDKVGLGAVRALRAAVAESGAAGGALLHRLAFSPDAWEFGRSKGLKLWLPEDLRGLMSETLGEPATKSARVVAPSRSQPIPRASLQPVRARKLLFLDLRLLDGATELREWLLEHPDIELVATTEREEALSRIAAVEPRLASRFGGVTPELPVGSSQRYFEIQAYLAQHSAAAVRWFAIDSEPNAFPCSAPGLLITTTVDQSAIAELSRMFEVPDV